MISNYSGYSFIKSLFSSYSFNLVGNKLKANWGKTKSSYSKAETGFACSNYFYWKFAEIVAISCIVGAR